MVESKKKSKIILSYKENYIFTVYLESENIDLKKNTECSHVCREFLLLYSIGVILMLWTIDIIKIVFSEELSVQICSLFLHLESLLNRLFPEAKIKG